MRFIPPGGNACSLDWQTHGAAVIGPVAQKRSNDVSVAGDEARPHTGNTRTLRQARKNHEATPIRAAERLRGFERAQGGLLKPNLGIALV